MGRLSVLISILSNLIYAENHNIHNVLEQNKNAAIKQQAGGSLGLRV